MECFFLASLERGGGKSRNVNTDSSLRLRYGMFWAVTGIPLENPMIDLSRDLSAFPVKWLGSIYLRTFWRQKENKFSNGTGRSSKEGNKESLSNMQKFSHFIVQLVSRITALKHRRSGTMPHNSTK
jgi:hypothetical protein